MNSFTYFFQKWKIGPRLSPKVTRSMEISIRMTWAVFLTMLFQYFWEWTSIIAYLSPIISVIASVLYFGFWQENALKATYGTIMGGSIGLGIGHLRDTKVAVVFLLFVALAWSGSIPAWDRLPKVMFTLALLLGAIVPITSGGTIVGLEAYKDLLALILVPYVITGFSLLFPHPALAFFKAKPQIIAISQKVVLMTKAIIRSFLSYDYLDLHIAEFNQLLIEVQADIILLKQLNQYIINEQMIFYEIRAVPKFIDMYLTTIDLILSELQGLRDMVTNITYNHTQYYFIQQIQQTLIEIQDEVEILITIVSEFFDLFTILPESVRRLLFCVYRCYRYCRKRTIRLFRRKRSQSVVTATTPSQKRNSFYHIPKSVELIETHQKHLLPQEKRFYQGEKRLSSSKKQVDKVKENKEEVSIHPYHAEGLQRERTPSVIEFGFHQYHLIGDKHTHLHEEGVEAQKPASTEENEKEEVSVKSGDKNETFSIKEEEDDDDEEEELQYDTKQHLFHLLRVQFEQTLAKLLHTRGKLLFQFQQIRKSYIHFDPNILPHFPDENSASSPPATLPQSPISNRSDASPRKRATSNHSTDLSSDGRDEAALTPSSSRSLLNKVQAEVVMLEEREHSRNLLLPNHPTSADPDGADEIFLEEEEESEKLHVQVEDEAKKSLLPNNKQADVHYRSPHRRSSLSLLATLPPQITTADDEEEEEKLLRVTLHQQMMNHPELIQLTVKEEIIRLSLKNIGPRGAYFHRLSILVEYLASFQIIIQQAEEEFNNLPPESSQCFPMIIVLQKLFVHYWQALAGTVFLYVSKTWLYITETIDMFVYFGLFLASKLKNRLAEFNSEKQLLEKPAIKRETLTVTSNEAKSNYDIEKGKFHENRQETDKDKSIFDEAKQRKEKSGGRNQEYDIIPPIKAYLIRTTQAYKVALAVTVASLLPIYNFFPSLLGRGFWTALVVALIRQENATSSFLTSYQRLEGTVIGSIFAFMMYEIFQCNDSASNTFCIQRFGVQIVVLIIWLFVCGLFRDGILHGYSATVAGFTPMVLLLNPSYLGLDAAFSRIEETFIAIVIYLAVDLLIFPQRIYPKVKISVLTCIKQCRFIVNETIQAVEILMKFEEFALRDKLTNHNHDNNLAAKGKEKSHDYGEKLKKVAVDNTVITTAGLPTIHEETKSLKLPPPVKISNPSSPDPLMEQKVSPRQAIPPSPPRSPNNFENRILDESNTYGDFIQVRYRTSSMAVNPTANQIMRLNSIMAPSPSASRKYSDASLPITTVITDKEKTEVKDSSNLSPREQAIEDLYHQCITFLDQGDEQLQAMKSELTKQSDYLKTIIHEPNLFYYLFPHSSYDLLHNKFQNVYRSSLALNHGSRTLIILIVQMLLKNENQIIEQLNHLLYMIKHLFLITNKSEIALTSAYTALQR